MSATQAAQPARATADTHAGWVQKLAVTVLVLTLLYVVFGVPGEDSTDTSQTDRVSPLNSWIWLGLLLLSVPVLQQRFRAVMALLLGNWMLLALMAYFTLSIGWALDPGAATRRLLFTFVQLGLFATLLSGIRRAPVLHVAIAATCMLAAMADLVSWVVVPGIAMTSEGFAGLQGQKNQTGLLMMLGLLAAFPCMFLVRRWLWKLFFAAGVLLMLGLLVATRSSTSQSVVIMAVAVIPVVLLIARLPKPAIWTLMAVSALALACAAFGYLAWCEMAGRDPLLPLRGATFTARTDIWSFVVDEIKKRPILGAGYGSFWAIDPAVQPSLKTDQWFGVDFIINEAHDGYLDLLATGGAVGLIAGLAVVVRSIGLAAVALLGAAPASRAWREGRLSRPTAVFYLAFLLGLVLHNFTESNLFSNNGLLAVGFLLCTLDLEKWRLSRPALTPPPAPRAAAAARSTPSARSA